MHMLACLEEWWVVLVALGSGPQMELLACRGRLILHQTLSSALHPEVPVSLPPAVFENLLLFTSWAILGIARNFTLTCLTGMKWHLTVGFYFFYRQSVLIFYSFYSRIICIKFLVKCLSYILIFCHLYVLQILTCDLSFYFVDVYCLIEVLNYSIVRFNSLYGLCFLGLV